MGQGIPKNRLGQRQAGGMGAKGHLLPGGRASGWVCYVSQQPHWPSRGQRIGADRSHPPSPGQSCSRGTSPRRPGNCRSQVGLPPEQGAIHRGGGGAQQGARAQDGPSGFGAERGGPAGHPGAGRPHRVQGCCSERVLLPCGLQRGLVSTRLRVPWGPSWEQRPDPSLGQAGPHSLPKALRFRNGVWGAETRSGMEEAGEGRL